MNWDAIGAIAEVVGAFAVVVTLIFLVIQLRLSTKAAPFIQSRDQGSNYHN